MKLTVVGLWKDASIRATYLLSMFHIYDMSAQNSKQGTNSRSAVAKCSCKKMVKDDDPSGIGCHECVKWFHGQCVSLSDDEVKWLGSRMNCLWMCDACLESNSPILPETKSLSLQNDNIKTYLKSISGEIDSLREVVSNQNSRTWQILLLTNLN